MDEPNAEENRSEYLTPVFVAELHRRDMELDADPSKAITWKQIREAIEHNPKRLP
jgi:putative addiction module component (TIGR02574 family)